MRLLVTGGAGYVGSKLVRLLLADGHSITVLDRLDHGRSGLPELESTERLRLIVGDVADREALAPAIDDVDAVVHLAALVGHAACHDDPEDAMHSNVTATRRLMAARRDEQFLVFASTESVYGPVPGGRCVETVACHPASTYGRTKLEAEGIVLDHANSVVLRFPSAFGTSPRQRWDLLIHDFVVRALAERRLDLYEPAAGRSFVHVVDMARSVDFALGRGDEMAGEIFNVGDPSLNMTKSNVLAAIESSLGIEIKVEHSPFGRDAERRDYKMSFEKLNRLGFTTSIGLNEGIREVAAILNAEGRTR